MVKCAYAVHGQASMPHVLIQPCQGYLSDLFAKKMSWVNKRANKIPVLLLLVYRKCDGEMLKLHVKKALHFMTHMTLKR